MPFKWKKLFWKAAKSAIYVTIAGVLTVYADKPWLLAIAPMLHGIENWIKHHNML